MRGILRNCSYLHFLIFSLGFFFLTQIENVFAENSIVISPRGDHIQLSCDHLIKLLPNIPTSLSASESRVVLPMESRSDSTAGVVMVADLGHSVFISTQKAVSGRVVPISFHQGRPMIHVVKNGKGIWFYQSFTGASGKEQGHWYPVGGLATTPLKSEEWIIKGPLGDKAYGREDLGELEDYINSVLPHSDKDVEAWVMSLAKNDRGIFAEEKTPTNVISVENFDRAYILQVWKNSYLTRVWGARR